MNCYCYISRDYRVIFSTNQMITQHFLQLVEKFCVIISTCRKCCVIISTCRKCCVNHNRSYKNLIMQLFFVTVGRLQV